MLVVCCYYYIYDQQGLVGMVLIQDVWGKSELSPLVIFNQNLKSHHLRKP